LPRERIEPLWPGEGVAGRRLAEAEALWWRESATERTLRRDGRRWTAWTASVVFAFATPALVLLAIEPLTFPAAAICLAHAIAVPWIQARRGARSPVPIGSPQPPAAAPGRSADQAVTDRETGSDRIALGLLGDLLGHESRDLVASTGLAMERGRLGVWLLGQQGAILVRPGGRRVFCWCVRVADPAELPAADRVAHLLLALREDEEGFATVANLQFSGALWRVRIELERPVRRALDSARRRALEPAVERP
jgi:hypothetical protein